MSLKNLTPVEVDVLYLERLAVLDKRASEVKYAASAVLYSAGYNVSTVQVDGLGRKHRTGVYVHPSCGLTRHGSHDWSVVEPHILTVERCIEEGLAPAAVQALGAAEALLGEALAACQECESEYNSRPWSRYWLVVSSDGHIHSGRSCCTCNKGKEPTRFALAAYLSGSSVETAVADLGPALCSVCYPEAPVESKEQARISSKLALALAEGGCEAFKKAREEAKEKALKRSADRCQGSGQAATSDARCPCCGDTIRRTATGKVYPHNRPRWFVEQNWGPKCWDGQSWAPSTRKAVYETLEAAQAAAAQAGPEAKIRRK